MESKLESPPQSSQHNPSTCLDGEEELGDFCLVCFSKVDRSNLPKQRNLMSNNLNVIFLLRKVLQVPSELLIGNFKKCGSPAYWISLCENCSQLTSQAMDHHLQILSLVNQLRSVLKLITEKMRDSPVHSETLGSYQDDKKKESMQEKRLHILKRTREFVRNYDYKTHLVNPFIEGDKLARELEDENEGSSSSAEDSEEDGDDGCGGGWGGAWQGEQEDKGTASQAAFKENPRSEYEIVDGLWKCPHCDKLFERKYNLRKHEEGRHPSVPGQFKCSICGNGINSRHYLNEHLRKTHKIDAAGKPIKTEPRKEEKEKDKQGKRAAHVEVNGKWKCRHCEKTFWSKSSVNLHENKKHAGAGIVGKFECDICGKGLSGKSYLLSHRRQVHKIDADGKPVEIVPRKEAAKKSEEGTKRRQRRKSGRTSSSLLVPVNGKWKCVQCDKEFTNRKSIYNHVRELHPAVEGQFSCDICGAAKNSRFGLMIHRRYKHKVNSEGIPIVIKRQKWTKRVKPVDPSTCHLCGKVFGWIHELRKHIKYVHEKQFEVRCHVCGLGMWGSSGLKEHLLRRHKDDPVTKKLVEEGARLWKCGVVGCRATYWKESRLEEHTRKVHKEGNGEEKDAQKRFTCSFCGKTFWYWHTLKVHETSHKLGKERPFSCELCGAKFKAAAYIRKHKKRFHPEANT